MIAKCWLVKLHFILSLSPKRGLNIFPLTRQKAYVPSRISPFPLVMSTRICWRKFSDFVSLKVAFNFAIARRTHRNLWQSFQLICALHFSLCHRHKYPATTHIAKSSPFLCPVTCSNFRMRVDGWWKWDVDGMGNVAMNATCVFIGTHLFQFLPPTLGHPLRLDDYLFVRIVLCFLCPCRSVRFRQRKCLSLCSTSTYTFTSVSPNC